MPKQVRHDTFRIQPNILQASFRFLKISLKKVDPVVELKWYQTTLKVRAQKPFVKLQDSYMLKSENFILTFCAPHPSPLPAGERGRVRGKFQIYLARFFQRQG